MVVAPRKMLPESQQNRAAGADDCSSYTSGPFEAQSITKGSNHIHLRDQGEGNCGGGVTLSLR